MIIETEVSTNNPIENPDIRTPELFGMPKLSQITQFLIFELLLL